MSYLLYSIVCLIYLWLCKIVGVSDTSESTAIILAILTAGEVISWRRK